MSEQEATLDEFVRSEGQEGDSSEETQMDWPVEKIKDHTELISGAHVKSDLVHDDVSSTPYLTGPEDFEGLGFTVTKYTDEPTNFCEPGDTLVTVKGSGCGKSAFSDQRACISRQLKALRPKSSTNSLYIYYMIKSKEGLLSTMSEGSAIPGLSNSHLTSLDIPVPSLEEQRQIASVLYTADQAILTIEELIKQANRVKKGLLQEFYSKGYSDHEEWQEVDKQDAYVMTRADEVPAEWTICEAGDIADIKTGHTPSTSVDEYWDGDISWVDIHDLTQLEKTVIETTDDTITEEGLENSGAKLLPKDTLVLCRTGAIGETAILGKEMATDQDQVTFECDESVVLPRYLMYLFEFATPQLERLSAGSTHDKIQLHFFSDLEIPLPSIDEQQKIVDALESIDDVVIANKEQLDSLERLKTGLRQDLISGDIRTAGKEIGIPDEVKNYEPE